MSTYVIGLDIGTSACKVIAVSAEGNVLGRSRREYASVFPRRGWVEVDAEEVWAAACSALDEVLALTRALGKPEAIAVSVSGDEVVPLDDCLRPLHGVIMSADHRGEQGLKVILSSLGTERVRSLTGLPPAPKFGVNRMMWLRDNMPEVFAKTRRFATWEDFVVARLTGRHVCSLSTAARLMCFDLGIGGWSQEILDAAQIGVELLPEVALSGMVVGRVAETGVRVFDAVLAPLVGVPVVAGGFDQSCSALGCGIIEAGVAGLGTGTMESAAFYSPGKLDTLPNNAANPSLTGTGYVYTATNQSGGGVLRWFRDNLGGLGITASAVQSEEGFDVLTKDLPQGPSGLLVMPHFSGATRPARDPLSSGVILGLRLSTSKGVIVKSLLEGVTFETKLLMDDFISSSGLQVKEIRASGGGARADTWLQLKADILNATVRRMTVVDSSAFGAAILAAVGVGMFEDCAAGVRAMVRTRDTFFPIPENVEAYGRYCDIFREIYPSLSSILHKLARQRGEDSCPRSGELDR